MSTIKPSGGTDDPPVADSVHFVAITYPHVDFCRQFAARVERMGALGNSRACRDLHRLPCPGYLEIAAGQKKSPSELYNHEPIRFATRVSPTIGLDGRRLGNFGHFARSARRR